jgi:hypothetical protein
VSFWLLPIAIGAVLFAAAAWVALVRPGYGPQLAPRVRLMWLAAGAAAPIGLALAIGGIAERTDFLGDGVMFLLFVVAAVSAFAIGLERCPDRRAWVLGHAVSVGVGLVFAAIVIAFFASIGPDF